MIRFAVEQCTAAGCGTLVQPISEKRQSADGFYESQGFTRHGYDFIKNLGR